MVPLVMSGMDDRGAPQSYKNPRVPSGACADLLRLAPLDGESDALALRSRLRRLGKEWSVTRMLPDPRQHSRGHGRGINSGVSREYNLHWFSMGSTYTPECPGGWRSASSFPCALGKTLEKETIHGSSSIAEASMLAVTMVITKTQGPRSSSLTCRRFCTTNGHDGGITRFDQLRLARYLYNIAIVRKVTPYIGQHREQSEGLTVRNRVAFPEQTDGDALPHRSLNRRRVLQSLLGGTGAGLSLPDLSASHPAHRHLEHAPIPDGTESHAEAADWEPSFLSSHHNETLITLAERVIPGSSRVAVNRFIDLALSIETQLNQERFLRAIAAFDAEAIRRFGNPFKNMTETQQDEILTVASTGEPSHVEKHPGNHWVAVYTRPSDPPPLVTLRDYFDYLKGWIGAAYYSTETGMRELGWTGTYAFDQFPGCPHPEGHR